MTLLQTVQQAFGDEVTIDSGESVHQHSEVWRARVHQRDGEVEAIVKRTWTDDQPALEEWQRALVRGGVRTVQPLTPVVQVPVDGDRQNWVAYPFVSGAAWDGSAEGIGAAARLLGKIHWVSDGLQIDGFPPFEWGNPERSSIEEDMDAVRASAQQHWPTASADRWLAQLDSFGTRTLPAMREATRYIPASLDHRAANLLFDADAAVMVDLENAVLAPRILDLAVAVLLFPLEHTGSAGRALSREEWLVFLTAYLETAPALEDTERRLWPLALTYMKLEWGTWHLVEDVEQDDANLGYLEDLLTMDEQQRYALPGDAPLAFG